MAFFDGVREFKKLVKRNYSVNSTSIYVFWSLQQKLFALREINFPSLALLAKRINVFFSVFRKENKQITV
jgi:hypothetical protein